MIKIVALNDPTKEEREEQEETIAQVSKEAQETIAVSEYLRALSLKQQGKLEFAQSLFQDLLRTQVLSDVPNDDKDNKLFSVKYNCFRNLGLIYEERKEWNLALKNLVEAINLDNGDVLTQCKVGRIAIKLNKLLLAQEAFESCLQRNPNHWGAKDGYLQTLCLMEQLDAAYGFAFKCYEEDRKYERAIRVLMEIRSKSIGSLDYYDGIYGYAPVFDKNCPVKYDPEMSIFPSYKEIGFTQEKYAILGDDFKIPEDELSWISFGKFILRAYKYAVENDLSLVTPYNWHDWVGKKHKEEVKLVQIKEPMEVDKENEEQIENKLEVNGGDSGKSVMPPPAPIDSNNEETNADEQDQENKKNRRRCSDLDFLKEWGWHKNRRSSRKKPKEEEETVDTSINGYLRRILANYFTQSFDKTKDSPFLPQVNEDEQKTENSEILDTTKADAEDEEKFNELSKDAFEEYKTSFKNRCFDIYIPISQWVRLISRFWNETTLPAEIISLYKKIYPIFDGYIEYNSLHHLSAEDFFATISASLFYYELMFDEYEETKVDIPDDFIQKKNYLQINLAYINDDIECTKMLLRFLRLSYGFQIHYNNYKDALGYLYKIDEIFDSEKYHDIIIDLKNCQHHKMLEHKLIKDMIVRIERKINMASVMQLYETQNYAELVDILLESIVYSTCPKVNIDTLMLKIQTQIQILLECLFSLNRIEECLLYAEKSLFYAVNNYLTAPTEFRLEEWATLINFCLVYIEAIIKEDGSEMLYTLNDKLPRLVQTLTQIIVNQHDVPIDKNNLKLHIINLSIPWIILYPIVQREDDIANALSGRKKEEAEITEEYGLLPNSLMMLFTAHEVLGRRQWCMKDNGKLWIFLLDHLTSLHRTPLLEPHRDVITEYLEQTTYCLYGFPAKKARLRHIEDHDAKNIDLTWERAIQLFDLYRPENLPEYDSVKLSSISSEMEQLLQKIILLIPKCLDIQPFSGDIKNFINGTTKILPKEINILPSKISSIYYLLADYYFKTQETGKAMKYFIYDLTMFPTRFDAWASMSLCKQSKLEKRLNAFETVDIKNFLEQADQAINCFKQCLALKKTSTIVTEFASFTYHLHSFCSRTLKQASENMSMENFAAIEERKDTFIDISLKCFTDVSQAITDTMHELNLSKNQEDSDDSHDEKWLCYFMLGKISEKKKEQPINYLNHYLKSAKYLYEDNATYPIKINHNNPTHLSIESLEVFYRITVCIMKYLEQHNKINKPTAKLFLNVLKELSTSPFAYNRAKINEDNINALKRKMNSNHQVATDLNPPAKIQKVAKLDELKMTKNEMSISEQILELMEIDDTKPMSEPVQPAAIKKIIATEGVSRRGSQESAITSTTTTSATHSSTTSSDSSSDSSDSDSTSSGDETDHENVFVDQEQINTIYKMCIKNLEECVSRFPEHYKSIYRLVHHFLHVNVDINKCRQLLLTSNYKTTLGNSINGLFSERKSNNFFNGIWRIPTAEIDRPGNFTSHLSKCIIILMDVLKKTSDHETLLDLALQLQKVPETEKRYLADSDRKELYQQALACCVQAFKNKMKEIQIGINEGKNENRDLLSLMLDIFKSHRRTYKNVTASKDQNAFVNVMIEVYKEYIKDRKKLPENANYCDLAFKMCQQELNYRKNLEKGIVGPNPNANPISSTSVSTHATSSPILVKSVSEINKSIVGTSTSNDNNQSLSEQNTLQINNKLQSSSMASATSIPRNNKPRASASSTSSKSTTSSTDASQQWLNSMLMAMYSNPSMLTSNYLNEYYKMLGLSNSSTFTPQQLALLNDPLMTLAGNSSSSPLTSPALSPSGASISSGLKGIDTKLLESLMKSTYGSSTLQGLEQNLKSNSLSITTKTITSTTTKTTSSTLNSSSKAQTSGSRKPNEIKNVVKKSISNQSSNKNNSGISTKYSSLFGSNLNLPDLPKSLSITPSMPSSSSSSFAPTNSPAAKVNEKKSSKETISAAGLGKFNLNPSLSITSEGLKATSSTKSKSSNANMLKSYEEFLKSYSNQGVIATNKKSSFTATSMSGASSSSMNTSKHKTQKSSLQISSVSSAGVQVQKIKSSAKVPYDFGKNIASSFMPVTAAPTVSSPFSHQTPPLPPPSPHAATPSPKTLQQKLAERKAQHQSKSTNMGLLTKKTNDDVIVLDDD